MSSSSLKSSHTLENGQSLFFLVMLASELLGLDISEDVLLIPRVLVKLDDKVGESADPTVTPSVTLCMATLW